MKMLCRKTIILSFMFVLVSSAASICEAKKLEEVMRKYQAVYYEAEGYYDTLSFGGYKGISPPTFPPDGYYDVDRQYYPEQMVSMTSAMFDRVYLSDYICFDGRSCSDREFGYEMHYSFWNFVSEIEGLPMPVYFRWNTSPTNPSSDAYKLSINGLVEDGVVEITKDNYALVLGLIYSDLTKLKKLEVGQGQVVGGERWQGEYSWDPRLQNPDGDDSTNESSCVPCGIDGFCPYCGSVGSKVPWCYTIPSSKSLDEIKSNALGNLEKVGDADNSPSIYTISHEALQVPCSYDPLCPSVQGPTDIYDDCDGGAAFVQYDIVDYRIDLTHNSGSASVYLNAEPMINGKAYELVAADMLYHKTDIMLGTGSEQEYTIEPSIDNIVGAEYHVLGWNYNGITVIVEPAFSEGSSTIETVNVSETRRGDKKLDGNVVYTGRASCDEVSGESLVVIVDLDFSGVDLDGASAVAFELESVNIPDPSVATVSFAGELLDDSHHDHMMLGSVPIGADNKASIGLTINAGTGGGSVSVVGRLWWTISSLGNSNYAVYRSQPISLSYSLLENNISCCARNGKPQGSQISADPSYVWHSVTGERDRLEMFFPEANQSYFVLPSTPSFIDHEFEIPSN